MSMHIIGGGTLTGYEPPAIGQELDDPELTAWAEILDAAPDGIDPFDTVTVGDWADLATVQDWEDAAAYIPGVPQPTHQSMRAAHRIRRFR